MRWSFKLATVAGIGIYIHLTFLMLVAFFAFNFFAQGGMWFAVHGTGLILALFGCVLLHELGHALTAKRFGVKTRDITLLPIGGVARLERIPTEPWQEFFIAIAGPLVNVGIAVLVGGALLLRKVPLAEILEDLQQVAGEPSHLSQMVGWHFYLKQILWLNVSLVLFNLIPAFPMDGGRILRSLLALAMEHNRATQIAATVGQGLAMLFGLIGILMSNPLLVLVAVFVFLGAAGEASASQLRAAFRGLPTSTGMVTEFKGLTFDDTLAHAVDLLLHSNQIDFPVLEDDKMAGMLTRQQLVASLRERGPGARLRDISLTQVQPIDADLPLARAYEEMNRQGTRSLPVLSGGKLVGLITAENIAELAMVRQALDRRSGG